MGTKKDEWERRKEWEKNTGPRIPTVVDVGSAVVASGGQRWPGKVGNKDWGLGGRGVEVEEGEIGMWIGGGLWTGRSGLGGVTLSYPFLSHFCLFLFLFIRNPYWGR